MTSQQHAYMLMLTSFFRPGGSEWTNLNYKRVDDLAVRLPSRFHRPPKTSPRFTACS